MTTSYGWQIVLADVGGLVVAGVVGAAGGGGASVAPYFLASPIVHGVHGNSGKAIGSLGLHLGLPIVGMLVGVGVGGHNCDSDACGLGGLVLGMMGGMVAATVVDAAWLAHTTVEVDSSQVSLAPTVTVARSGGATFGVAATF